MGNARLLADVCEQSDEPVPLFLENILLNEHSLAELNSLLGQFPGRAPVEIHFIEKGLHYHLRLPNHNIKPGHHFYKMFNEWRTNTN